MPAGTLIGDVKPILRAPEFENSLTRASGGRASPEVDSAAYYFMSSRCLRTSFLTLGTPVVRRAARGTGTNILVSGILSTGVVIISACSSLRGGTSNSRPPGIDTFLGIYFFLSTTASSAADADSGSGSGSGSVELVAAESVVSARSASSTSSSSGSTISTTIV